MKLKVQAEGLTANGSHVWLDGHEISDGLTGLTINFDAQEITTAEVRVIVDELEIDAEVLAMLTAQTTAPEASQ